MLFHALDKITDKDSNDQLFKGRDEKKHGSLLGFSTTPGSVFRSQVKAAQSKWTETRVHTQPAIIQLWVCFCHGDTALCPICWVIKPALLIKSFALQGGKQRTTQADWADTHTPLCIFTAWFMFIWSIKQQKLHLLFLLVEKWNIVDFSSRQKNAYEVGVQKCMSFTSFRFLLVLLEAKCENKAVS